MPKKVKIYSLVAMGINEVMRNQRTLIVSLLTICSVISFSLIPVTHDFWGLFIFTSTISLIFAFSTVRLSNVCVYNKLTKHMSMAIDDFEPYHELSYIEDRNEVARRFQEEFIEAIVEAKRRNYKKIRMTTHHWIVANVTGHETIQMLYNTDIKPSGSCKIPFEVLLLASKDTLENYTDELKQLAFRKRKEYKITLKS